VSENKVLKTKFGPKGEEVTRGWRKLHNEELHNLYTTQNTVVMKSRTVRWARHVTCMGGMGNVYKLWSEGKSR
jgi:hypothetical protein